MQHRSKLRLGLIAVMAGAALVSCGQTAPDRQPTSASSESRGSVELGLVPVSGVTLNTVHYAVTTSAPPPALIAEGDLPTSGSSSEFSFGLSLPVGSGYSISLSAASAEPGDNITCGGAFSPFDVTPNSASNFKVVLTCHDDSNGAFAGEVQTVTDACPRLVFDYTVASPTLATIGQTITVQGKAHDLDGKPVTYSWKVSEPSAATLSPTTGSVSTLSCTGGRAEQVTITANNGECTKSLSTSVTCVVDFLCGNGVIDPGETCDKALPAPCPANCVSVCGNGVVDLPVETCEPPNTPTCSASCTAQFILPSVCGSGIVDGTKECDDAVAPFPSAAASSTCSSTCTKISTAACVSCENAGDCFESVNNCLGVAAPFSLADQNKCFDVMSCIEKSNCFDGTGTLGKCYCGSLSTAACGAAPFSGPGSPDGACVAQIKGGFPNFTTNSAVLGGLTATDFPAGAAMKRLSCQKGANSSACLGVCGFTAGGPAFP